MAKVHMQDRKTINYCQNVIQYLTARTHLIDLYILKIHYVNINNNLQKTNFVAMKKYTNSD